MSKAVDCHVIRVLSENRVVNSDVIKRSFMLSFNLYGMCSGSVGCKMRVGEADENCCGFLLEMKKKIMHTYIMRILCVSMCFFPFPRTICIRYSKF